MTDEEYLAEIRKRLTGWISPRKGLFAGDIEEIVFLLRLLDEREAGIAKLRAPKKCHWWLGSMNDGLFIINTPPRPSTDDIHHDRTDGPSVVLNITDLPSAKARGVVDAHNTAIEAAAQSAREEVAKIADGMADSITGTTAFAAGSRAAFCMIAARFRSLSTPEGEKR